ncbi:MAG: LysM peptidoglycan-binding domain-containing protein [Chloroflexi bacterium]|nr:LysM peptidoglycan-binding domain-containing protein [Chloroflexota bacterium]
MNKRLSLPVLLLLSIVLLAAPLLRATPLRAQDVVGDLLGRINNLRAGRGLYPYSYNGALAAAAQSQAQWMAETGSVSHVRPDGSSPRTRAAAAGYGTTAVSENIYAGTLATVDDAWNFWINSSIHFAGLTSGYYSEIGIGYATTSWGSAFVLVFGNPGGPAPALPASSGSSDSSEAVGAPPSFVVGVDASGNIMHEIQPGDTPGGIALLYGYTWDDIPALLALNGLSDPRDLVVGEIFLVPPRDGTYTPTPSDVTASATPSPDPAQHNAQLTADAGRVLTAVAFATYTVTPLPMMPGAAPAATAAPTQSPTPFVADTTAVALALAAATATPSPVSVATEAALVRTAVLETQQAVPGNSGIPAWVLVAVLLQVTVLVLAGAEFVLRARRKR